MLAREHFIEFYRSYSDVHLVLTRIHILLDRGEGKANILIPGSRTEVFCEKGVLRKSAKLTIKHLCRTLFFNKIKSLMPATLLKKILQHWCFPVNFAKFLRIHFLYSTSGGCLCYSNRFDENCFLSISQVALTG